MMARSPALGIRGLVLLVTTACSGTNSLGGSIGELFSLEVSRVEVLRNSEAIQISYYSNRGEGIDIVARVTVATQDIDLRPHNKIQLRGEYRPGHQRTTVIHFAWGEPVRNLPPVKRGDLTIASGGNPGESTRGDFSMSFDQGGDVGAGRTLYGNFSTTAADAGFGP